MPIAFNQIALNILTPGVFAEFDNSRAVQGVSLYPQTVLITGQKLGTGTATAGVMYAVESAAEAIVLFGATSQLAQMIAAYKTHDPLTELFACSTAADAGTNAAGNITWSGTATEAGEIVFYVGGRRVPVAVADGDTAATIETSALAAFALQNDLPVTVAANAATGVDFTAVQDGTIGNSIFLGVCLLPGERVPAGITMAAITAMASGATDPAYSGVITAMGDDWYTGIACGNPVDSVMDAFETELEDRWGPMRAIEGFLYAALYDTRANLTTAGNARNSLTTRLMGAEKSAALPLPWELAAATLAIRTARNKVDPARSVTGSSYKGYNAAPRGARFSRAERDVLLSDGVSTVYAGSDGRLRLERLVTTWQTNAQSIPDTSYQDVTTTDLLAALRYSVRARISSKFAQFKLTDDGNPIPAGQPIVSPAIIKDELIILFQEWQGLGWVENLEQFVEELTVERSETDPNRVDVILPPDLINNFLVCAVRIAFKR